MGTRIIAENIMSNTNYTQLQEGLTTAYIDGTAAANLAYKPAFVSNNPTGDAVSNPERDTRQIIVDTAERFFRDIGYQKTTVADIAKSLRMSPANVYRFFDSKKSINEAVLERYKREQEEAIATIAAAGRADPLAHAAE